MSNSEIEKWLILLISQQKRQSELIEDVLTWSHLTNRNIKINREALNLWEEIQNVIMLLSLSAENKNINLNNSTNKELNVYCDRVMLQVVIRNLISNAIKFSYQGGENNFL